MKLEDFNPYKYNREGAVCAISDRIEMMQRLYSEALYIAEAHDLNVSLHLEAPDDIRSGWEADIHASWNPSSASC